MKIGGLIKLFVGQLIREGGLRDYEMGKLDFYFLAHPAAHVSSSHHANSHVSVESVFSLSLWQLSKQTERVCIHSE